MIALMRTWMMNHIFKCELDESLQKTAIWILKKLLRVKLEMKEFCWIVTWNENVDVSAIDSFFRRTGCRPQSTRTSSRKTSARQLPSSTTTLKKMVSWDCKTNGKVSKHLFSSRHEGQRRVKTELQKDSVFLGTIVYKFSYL